MAICRYIRSILESHPHALAAKTLSSVSTSSVRLQTDLFGIRRRQLCGIGYVIGSLAFVLPGVVVIIESPLSSSERFRDIHPSWWSR